MIIKQTRKKIGLTQSEFAKQCGIGRATIGHYEIGAISPSITMAYKIIDLAKKYKIKLTLEDIYPRS